MKTFFKRNCRAGFSLVEVAVALGIFAFAITAVLGAFLVGMSTGRDTMGTQVAANIANSIANDLAATPPQAAPPNATAYYSPRYYINNQNTTATALPPFYFDQTGAVCPAASAVYKATLTYRSLINPTAAPPTTPDSVDILVSWPAAAVATANTNPPGSYEVLVRVPQPQ